MGWLILIDILLIIVLALMLSVTVTVHLNDDTRIKVKYAGITIFSVSPEDEKLKKEKQKKKKQKQNKKEEKAAETITKSEASANKKTDNPEEKTDKDKKENTDEKKEGKQGGLMSKLGLSGDIGETIEFAKQLISSACRPIKRLINHIRVNSFMLYVCAGGDDAAKAALNYGKINWLVHTAIGFLYNIVRLDVKKIDITTDFTSEETKYELSCKVKLRLGTALGCIIWLLFRLAKLYLKININSTKKRTAEAKPDAGKA